MYIVLEMVYHVPRRAERDGSGERPRKREKGRRDAKTNKSLKIIARCLCHENNYSTTHTQR